MKCEATAAGVTEGERSEECHGNACIIFSDKCLSLCLASALEEVRVVESALRWGRGDVR
jgi:hypothetical protein